MDFLTKTFYLVNPLAVDSKKQDKFQEFFLKKWIAFSKNNLLLNEKWKSGFFKFSSKNKVISERDIPLLLCFETLQNNLKTCKVDVNTFKILFIYLKF